MMKYSTFVAAVALASVQSVWGLMINTPTSVVQCQPILLTWSGGQPPYFLSALPGGQASAPALKSWDSTSDTSVTWTVDLQAGTSLTMSIKDSTGAIAYSDAVTIQSSSQTDCLSSSGGSASPAGSGSSSPAPAAVSSTSTSTSAAPSATSAPSSSGSVAAATSNSAHTTGSQSAVVSARPNAAVGGYSAKVVIGGLASFVAVAGALLF